MTIKNHDRYLAPPDEPEAQFCESCGHKVAYIESHYIYMGYPVTDLAHTCTNSFCPDKHTGIAKEMAEKIVELTEELEEYKLRVKVLKNKLGV